ncbi:phosphotransferase [Paenibacillus sp. FSL L8-0493]|uniref:phosphotransferase n=1 Tax=unclassified Paenibacillus TaxID=185978 RepID=UPI0030D35E93
MEAIRSEEAILEDLSNSFYHFFGLKVLHATPIKRGWLNLKWKITTDSGQFLLKQYNKKRYKLYNPEELNFAFSQQKRLYLQGLPCPGLLAYNNNVLLESDQGETFMAMEYCEGRVIEPGKINIHQMFDLGRATGKMHRLLNDGTISLKRTPQFIPQSPEERLEHWNVLLQQSKEMGKTSLITDLEIQLRATEEIDPEIFEGLEAGWAHRDLWVDNLLFQDSQLSAILDFDRFKYDYPQLDVARAVMSCALDEDLDGALASAFIDGYREERTVEQGDLTKSLQLLWYMESPWWINAEMDKHSVPPKRFAKEMNWLAKNLNNLHAILGNL